MVAGGGGWMEGEIVMKFEIDMYMWLYLKWTTSRVQLYGTGNSA